MSTETDEALVTSARAADDTAFTALVERHQERAYRLAMRLVGNASDAEEVVQEAFLRAYRSLDGFRATARFSTWLYRIVVNEALMRMRSSRRRPTESLEAYLPAFDDEGGLVGHGPDCAKVERADELLERRELAQQIRDALERLDDGYRSVFVLRDLEGLPTEEVAELLQLSQDVVRQRLHRARVMLRGYLRAIVGGER